MVWALQVGSGGSTPAFRTYVASTRVASLTLHDLLWMFALVRARGRLIPDAARKPLHVSPTPTPWHLNGRQRPRWPKVAPAATFVTSYYLWYPALTGQLAAPLPTSS